MSVSAWSLGLLVGSYVLLHYVFRLDQAKASFSAIGIMLAAMLPHFGFTKDTGSFFPIFTVVLCAVYALFALGLNIVVGFAGLLDLGYVAFFLFGAYVAAWLMSIFAVNVTPSWSDINIHFRDTADPNFPGIHIIVLACGGRRGRRRGDRRRGHRRANSAIEERLPGPGDARLRRDPAGSLPQRRRPPRAQPHQRHEGNRTDRQRRNGPARRSFPAFPKSSPRPTSKPSTT